jgi:hypothetical protein
MHEHVKAKISMKNYLTFLLILCFSLGLQAQKENSSPAVYASFHSYASTGEELPFWLRANQNGAFQVGNSATQLLRAGIFQPMNRDSSSWGFTYGADLVAGSAGETYFQPNQYWLGVRFHKIVVQAGSQADPVRFGGLSTTNGNMDASNNARPVPQLSLATNGFVNFRFLPRWLSIKGLYAEGKLWDDGYVKDARLHHKNIYLKVTPSQKWSFSLGLEHYVFWGGNSPDYGQLAGSEEYFRYILGGKGGAAALKFDQKNGAGNQLGIYSLEISKKFDLSGLTFYVNHPFEDRSGREMANFEDGLYGIHWKNDNRQKPLTELVYEFMSTVNQSGPLDPFLGNRGRDNYFNNFIYSSGFTHYSQMMGTPLFVPETDVKGVSKGFESTRMWMHHLGLKGAVCTGLQWKTMLTWSRNIGRYDLIYLKPVEELSFLVELNYHLPGLPLQLNTGFAGDSGERFEKRVGGFVGVKWEISTPNP